MYSQSYGFSSSRLQMWELDHKEGWVLKNCCFWIVVQRRLVTVPCTARKSNQSTLKEINPEYSLKGLMLKLKLQYFGHLMWRKTEDRNLFSEDDRGWDGWMSSQDWRQEKGMTEDEMIGWYHQLSGHKSEQTPRDSEGQGSLVCCSPWGWKSQTRLSDWIRNVAIRDFYYKH